MAFLDALTGGAYDRAAKANGQAISTGLNQSGDALLTSYGNSQKLLLDGSSPSALTALGSGYGQARTDIGNQYQQTQGYLGQLGSNYNHMAAGGQGAFDRYLNATGGNGSAGSAQAAQDFSEAPGTRYAMDQALDAVQRTAAARGGLAGGNATVDILKTATGLADQNFQQYIQNLGTAANSYGTALSGQSQGLAAQANASQNYGTQLGTLGTGLGTGTASLYGAGATAQQNLGNQFSNNINAATGQLVNSNNTRAARQTAASGNAIGLVGGIANSVLGQVGGLGGLANLFGGGGGGLFGGGVGGGLQTLGSLPGDRNDQWY